VKPPRFLLYGALLLLLALHQDLWFWGEGRRLLGLPVGLTYHLLYCLAASLLMAAFVRWLWPRDLEAPGGPEPEARGREKERGGEEGLP